MAFIGLDDKNMTEFLYSVTSLFLETNTQFLRIDVRLHESF
jgi:hypothetical protein